LHGFVSGGKVVQLQKNKNLKGVKNSLFIIISIYRWGKYMVSRNWSPSSPGIGSCNYKEINVSPAHFVVMNDTFFVRFSAQMPQRFVMRRKSAISTCFKQKYVVRYVKSKLGQGVLATMANSFDRQLAMGLGEELR